MARICVQCDKKIGLFKTPIEEIYCYNTCRDAARHDIAENERRSAERKVQEEHAAQVAEEEDRAPAAQQPPEPASQAARRLSALQDHPHENARTRPREVPSPSWKSCGRYDRPRAGRVAKRPTETAGP